MAQRHRGVLGEVGAPQQTRPPLRLAPGRAANASAAPPGWLKASTSSSSPGDARGIVVGAVVDAVRPARASRRCDRYGGDDHILVPEPGSVPSRTPATFGTAARSRWCPRAASARFGAPAGRATSLSYPTRAEPGQVESPRPPAPDPACARVARRPERLLRLSGSLGVSRGRRDVESLWAKVAESRLERMITGPAPARGDRDPPGLPGRVRAGAGSPLTSRTIRSLQSRAGRERSSERARASRTASPPIGRLRDRPADNPRLGADAAPRPASPSHASSTDDAAVSTRPAGEPRTAGRSCRPRRPAAALAARELRRDVFRRPLQAGTRRVPSHHRVVRRESRFWRTPRAAVMVSAAPWRGPGAWAASGRPTR